MSQLPSSRPFARHTGGNCAPVFPKSTISKMESRLVRMSGLSVTAVVLRFRVAVADLQAAVDVKFGEGVVRLGAQLPPFDD